jgi:hypothetical protein
VGGSYSCLILVINLCILRKQLYIEPDQNVTLREQATKYNVSEGQIVREAITAYLTMGTQSQETDLPAWEEERQFILSRRMAETIDAAGGSKSTAKRTWTRNELYDM